MKYSAAIDLSGKAAGFALAETDSGKLLLSECKAMRGRSSSGLSTWILGLMEQFKLTTADINRWTVGSGPGSFTGMRLAAALVIGITMDIDKVKTRCVPTALALAGAFGSNDGDKVAALFDGRNQEILLFELVNKAGELVPTGKSKVLDREAGESFFADNDYRKIVAFEYDSPNINTVLNSETSEKVEWIKNPAFEKLIQCKYKKFDNNLTDLVYIRPAVFS